jgi:hypothetical protein
VVACGVAALAIITLLVATGGGDAEVVLTDHQPVTVTGEPLPPFVAGTADTAVGMPVPDIDGKSFGGTNATTTSDEPTMIIVVTPWNEASQREVEALVQWHHADLTPEGLKVLTVVTGADPTKANSPAYAWLVREEWPFPVLADDEAGTAAAALGATADPLLLFVDDKGTVQFRGGEMPIADVEAQVANVLAV